MAYPLAERPERPKRKPSEYDDKPIGTQFADEAEKALEWASSLPGVRPVLQTVGGALRVGYEKIIEPMKYESEQLLAGREANIPSAVVGSAVRAFEFGTKTGEVLGAEAAEALNVDPRIGSFLGGGVAETVMTAGVGTVAKKAVKAIDMMTPPGAGGLTPALAGVGGGLKLNFDKPRVDVPEAPQVMPITVEPRLRAAGMVQDVAQQPEFRAALDRRTQALKEVRANIAKREAQGKTAAKYNKELAGKGSTLDYDPNDPIVFEKARYKVYDPLDPERTAQQHHLFAKAQSYPFVEKMEELIAAGIADEDDLVNMFAWADMLDVTMGNTRKNMLDAPGRSHIDAAPGSTAFDKTRNIHTLLKEFDLEISGKKVREKVKNAQNATELMDIFNDYIIESVKPQKRVAQRIVDDFIVRQRATLPKDQLSMFDDLASKLGGRYKPN